LGSLELKSNL